jgi:glycosyltransferase involved in cell wall biosynthesis
MRIAIDATVLYGRRSGIGNFAWNLLSELAALDEVNEYLIYVVSDAPGPPEEVAARRGRWEWRRLPFAGDQKLRRIFWQQTALPWELKRSGCGLIHGLSYVMPLLSPVPAVVTMHDLIALNHPRFARRSNRLHYRLTLPRTLKRAARLAVTTERIRREIARRVPDDDQRVRTVPMGVEPYFFDPEFRSEARVREVRRKYQLPDQFLLFAGNFEPKKNLANLLRAVDLLEDAPPLVIAGGVNPWPGYEGMKGRARVIGYVPREELPALFAACEVFCFPSLTEGFGMPVVEAMACGAPIFASPAVPLPHLDQVAALAPPRAPRAMADTLRNLLGDRARREEMSALGIEYARQFTWERHARGVLEIYRELGAS